MKFKKLASLILAGAMALSLAACGGNGAEKTPGPVPSTSPSASPGEKEPDGPALKMGLVLSTGGLGDKNFNDMGYDGMLKAEKELGVGFDYLDSESASDFVPNLRMLAESGEYALIIGLGADMGEAMLEVAEDFPEQKFSHIDSQLKEGPVSAVQTRWPEQTFLTGVMAGLGTLSNMDKANGENVVGVILGMDNPALRNGVAGFTAGVKYVNPDCEVLVGNVDSFNDPGKGKEIALSLYHQGADFILALAGASNMGIFNGAKEAGRYAFAAGANGNYIEPDYIVATAARKVDEMVFNEIAAVVNGTWSSGSHITGLKEGVVGYVDAQSNVVVPDDIKAAIEKARGMVADGTLTLPDATEDMAAWVAANQYEK